ncbi:MAG: TspO/MBR family protein [Pseudomonadota bacterium]
MRTQSQPRQLINPMMILPAAVATAAAALVAFLGATMTDLGPWYQTLEKPAWTPPDGLFPIVWTIFYALITVAGITAWRAAPTARAAQNVIGLFALNAFLNIAWSLLFFRFERPDWALIEVGFLAFSIIGIMIYARRFSAKTCVLLAPYLAWVALAATLNWAVVQLNGPFG